MDKLCFIDFETTGTDPKIHAPHQIAAILEVDGQEVDRIDIRMFIPASKIPYVEEEALKVSGLSLQAIQVGGIDPARAAYDFTNAIRKYWTEDCRFHIVEWNTNGFDSQFLREWLGGSAMQQFFYSNPVNVLSLASNALRHTRSDLPDFKLGTVAAHLGITATGALHDALVDVELTREIYKCLNGERGL